jgi:two-component system response regulator FlrC
VLARYSHQHSPRAEGPFLAVNCAAIPENMLESMLFGYEKGAYTGAYQSRPGKFEQANGGTVLLDEISEMDLGLQAKLLRVLQEREVERLGGNKLIALDVRVLATTNRRLEEEVRDGNFREDLYYRLSVFPLHLPPLRERRGDIVPLASRFLARYAGGRNLRFSTAVEAQLRAHHWRGNIRELENCIQRATILVRGDEIGSADIMLDGALDPARSNTPAAAEEPSPEAPLAGDLKQREQSLILDALNACGGNRKDAATRLGISPRTLRYKLARLRELGIETSRGGALDGALSGVS